MLVLCLPAPPARLRPVRTGPGRLRAAARGSDLRTVSPPGDARESAVPRMRPPGPARTPLGRRPASLLDLRADTDPPVCRVRTAAPRQRHHASGTGVRQLLHQSAQDVRYLRHRRPDLGEGSGGPPGHLRPLLPAAAQGMQCVRPHPRRKPHRRRPGRLPLRHLHSPASSRLWNLRPVAAGQDLLAAGARMLCVLPPTAGFSLALRRVLRHQDPGRDHGRPRLRAVHDLLRPGWCPRWCRRSMCDVP